MTYDVIKLINLLKKINEYKNIDLNKENIIVDEIIYLANDCRTGDEKFKNIITVRENGFDVFAGERDRFGWLTGCIRVKHGIIVFG